MTPKKPPRAATKRRKSAPAKRPERGAGDHAFHVLEPLEVPQRPPSVPAALFDDPGFREDWDSLPERQQAFLLALPETGSATSAYLTAYPDCRSRHAAKVNAYYLLRKPAVARCGAAFVEAKLEDLGVTSSRILEEVARLAFTSMTDVATWDEEGVHFIPSAQLTPEARAAIKSIKSKRRTVKDKNGAVIVTVEQEITLHPKLDALSKLGDYKKLFTKQLEVHGLAAIALVLSGLPKAEVERMNALPPDELAREIAVLVKDPAS